MRALLPLLLLACRIPPVDPVEHVDPVLTTPELTAVSWVCEADRERWQLDATASSWTGAGTLWLTVDGHYIEQHAVPSIRIEPDGSQDELRLRLDMEADWRAVTPGDSTAFTCTEPPDGLFVLWDRDDEQVDCALIGEGLAHPSLPACDDPFSDVEQ